eukprot:435432_1
MALQWIGLFGSNYDAWLMAHRLIPMTLIFMGHFVFSVYERWTSNGWVIFDAWLIAHQLISMALFCMGYCGHKRSGSNQIATKGGDIDPTQIQSKQYVLDLTRLPHKRPKGGDIDPTQI